MNIINTDGPDIIMIYISWSTDDRHDKIDIISLKLFDCLTMIAKIFLTIYDSKYMIDILWLTWYVYHNMIDIIWLT